MRQPGVSAVLKAVTALDCPPSPWKLRRPATCEGLWPFDLLCLLCHLHAATAALFLLSVCHSNSPLGSSVQYSTSGSYSLSYYGRACEFQHSWIDTVSVSAACPAMQSSAKVLAIGPTSRRTGALPSSSIRKAYTSSLTLLRSTPTAPEHTCNASGREMPGWLCRYRPGL